MNIRKSISFIKVNDVHRTYAYCTKIKKLNIFSELNDRALGLELSIKCEVGFTGGSSNHKNGISMIPTINTCPTTIFNRRTIHDNVVWV